MTTRFAAFACVALAALATGCVEHRVVYVPAPQPPPGTVPAPGAATAPSGAVVTTQAPPDAPMEAVPAPPGPAYYWVPGYWAWNNTWVWMSGAWVVRPHPTAVWIGGRWARQGRGYIWIGGRWR